MEQKELKRTKLSEDETKLNSQYFMQNKRVENISYRLK